MFLVAPSPPPHANACAGHRSCDQILRVGFTLLGIFPDITDRISSIAVGQ